MNLNSSIRRRMLGIAAALLLAALPAFASVAGTFDRSYQVNGPVDLEVLTRSGDITVHNGPSGSVSIHGKIHVGNSWFGGDRKSDVQEIENNPPIRQSGNSIRIDYVNINNISIDYEITVPENTAVRAHTGSGDQNVEGLNGNIDLESGSGDLKLARLTGDMHFQTGSGNVRAPRALRSRARQGGQRRHRYRRDRRGRCRDSHRLRQHHRQRHQWRIPRRGRQRRHSRSRARRRIFGTFALAPAT